MKLLLVDDEPLARSRLRRLLEPLLPEAEVAEAGDSQQAVALLQQDPVDVLFLDMAMPGMSGLDFAHTLKTLYPQLSVIFVTAYAEHALDAYRVAPLDYLLKPVSRERLIEALARLPKTDVEPVLLYRQGALTQRLLVRDIVVLSADDKYVRADTLHGSVLLDQSLKQLEQMFPDRFVRVHRHTLVAREKIQQLRLTADGKHQVVLADGSMTADVSRRELATLRTILQHV